MFYYTSGTFFHLACSRCECKTVVRTHEVGASCSSFGWGDSRDKHSLGPSRCELRFPTRRCLFVVRLPFDHCGLRRGCCWCWCRRGSGRCNRGLDWRLGRFGLCLRRFGRCLRGSCLLLHWLVCCSVFVIGRLSRRLDCRWGFVDFRG